MLFCLPRGMSRIIGEGNIDEGTSRCAAYSRPTRMEWAAASSADIGGGGGGKTGGGSVSGGSGSIGVAAAAARTLSSSPDGYISAGVVGMTLSNLLT